jgi:hypothetical protein
VFGTSDAEGLGNIGGSSGRQEGQGAGTGRPIADPVARIGGNGEGTPSHRIDC